MKMVEQLSALERKTLEELRTCIAREFPNWNVRMMLFGSRARGDAEPDSDMDVLLEIETEKVSFPEKQRIRRIAGEISMDTGHYPGSPDRRSISQEGTGRFLHFPEYPRGRHFGMSHKEIREFLDNAIIKRRLCGKS